MGSSKPRAQRWTVILKAQMRDVGGWRAVTICNVSSRGLMAKCSAPPAKGAYIELRYRSVYIVGRVAWSQGSRFGVRTQDKIDIATLLDESPIKGIRTGEAIWTAAPRSAAQPNHDLPAQIANSRHIARAFDWWVVVLGSVIAASVLFGAVSAALKTPMQEVEATLAGANP